MRQLLPIHRMVSQTDNFVQDMNKVPKKILFIIFQSDNQSNGGVESISQIIYHLRNWEYFLLTNRETSKNQSWKNANVNLKVNSADISGNIPGKLLSLIIQNFTTYQFIRQNKIRLVHFNDIQSIGSSGLGAKLAGAQLVFNIRDVKALHQQYGLKWKLAKYFVNYILVLSAEMKEQLVRRLHFKSEHKVGYQYSIVDLNRFMPYDIEKKLNLKKNLGILPNTYNIGIIAAFMPKKQQLAFIRQAVPLIVNAIPHAVIYFIGDFDKDKNKYAKDCWQAAKDIGTISHIKFIGYQPNINEWYNTLDVTVVASEREGLARCMIESLACGTPVVSFDVCSAKEILEAHQCGFVVKQGDYNAMAEAISTLHQNQDTYRKFSENGIKASRSLFDKQKIVSYYEELYNGLLN